MEKYGYREAHDQVLLSPTTYDRLNLMNWQKGFES